MYDFWGIRPLEETHQGPQTNGVWARFGRLVTDHYVFGLCFNLSLTTPNVLVAHKVLGGGPEVSLTHEEQGILAGFALPRGYKDERCTPIVDGNFVYDYVPIVVDMLSRMDMTSELPKTPKEAFQPHHILFSSQIRLQSLSVLWDIVFDGIEKGSPFGRVKPWVMEELQIFGLATLGNPMPDGKPGRPPRRIIVNSWGRRLAEVTRDCGVEITDVHRQSARNKPSKSRTLRFNTSDMLASGYMARGYEIPKNVLKGMSTFGKQTLGIETETEEVG